MFLTAYITGTFAIRYKEQARQSAKIARRTKILFDANQMLSKAHGQDEIIHAAAEQIMKLLGRNIVVFYNLNGQLSAPILFCTEDGQIYDPEKEQEAAAWVLKNNHAAGATTDIFPDTRYFYLEIRANLLRTISHDLRTPLTTISGNADNLLCNAGSFDEETKKQIYSDIYDDSMWLIDLVENLLYATRIEEGRMTLRTSTELLSEILEESMQHVKRKAAAHSMIVVCEDDLLLVRADAKLIVQVITNIVDNALKYTPAGSVITLTAGKANGMAEIQIADTGKGIPDEEKQKVFDKFYCGKNKIADNRRSLGLGLYLCKAIVEAHGGTIRVTDNLPKGAVFSFTLPLEEAAYHE